MYFYEKELEKMGEREREKENLYVNWRYVYSTLLNSGTTIGYSIILFSSILYCRFMENFKISNLQTYLHARWIISESWFST